MTLDSRLWFWLLVGAVSIYILHLLEPILMPFVAGALLAYLADPLADRLEALKLSRTLSVVVVFLVGSGLVLLCLLVLIPVLETQISGFIKRVPKILEWALGLLVPYLRDTMGIEPEVLQAEQLTSLVTGNLKETGGLIRNAIQTVSKSGFALMGLVANLAMIPIIAFYLLRDWDRLVAYIDDLLPRDVQPMISMVARESDDMLGAFLRGQVLVMLGLSVLYSVGLWLVGLEFALLIGLIAGLVSFVPYLGFIVGAGIATIAVLFQTQDIFQVFWVFVVFGVAQVIESVVLTPVLVGERIGLHPVAVIFAVLAGGQLFGFFGVLLALPVAAVLAVILRHLHDSYKQSRIYRIRVD